MEQDREQEIMTSCFHGSPENNYSLAFPWSKKIIDEHHVFFTFTINYSV